MKQQIESSCRQKVSGVYHISTILAIVLCVLISSTSNAQKKNAKMPVRAIAHAQSKNIKIAADNGIDPDVDNPNINATISFFDKNDNPIPFSNTGGENATLVSDDEFKLNDQVRFDVKGYAYVATLGFNYDNNTWDLLSPTQAAVSKGLAKKVKAKGLKSKGWKIMDKIQDQEGDVLSLPGAGKYFTIDGTNTQNEQFLVLVSNDGFDPAKLSQLDKSTAQGTAILDEIKRIFGGAEPPSIMSDGSSFADLNITNTGKKLAITPLYYEFKRK